MKKWKELPPEMQTEEVRKYYKILEKHKAGLVATTHFRCCCRRHSADIAFSGAFGFKYYDKTGF